MIIINEEEEEEKEERKRRKKKKKKTTKTQKSRIRFYPYSSLFSHVETIVQVFGIILASWSADRAFSASVERLRGRSGDSLDSVNKDHVPFGAKSGERFDKTVAR